MACGGWYDCPICYSTRTCESSPTGWDTFFQFWKMILTLSRRGTYTRIRICYFLRISIDSESEKYILSSCSIHDTLLSSSLSHNEGDIIVSYTPLQMMGCFLNLNISSMKVPHSPVTRKVELKGISNMRKPQALLLRENIQHWVKKVWPVEGKVYSDQCVLVSQDWLHSSVVRQHNYTTLDWYHARVSEILQQWYILVNWKIPTNLVNPS